MKMELIKPVIRVGNSAGVLVPKEWMNGSAKVELIAKPINVKKDILEILSPYLEDIIGIYLTGSYAREEQTKESDIDVLVITYNLNNLISSGRYNVILISEDKIADALESDAMPIIPLLMEAKILLNRELIEKYRKKIKLSNKNLKWYLAITKSAVRLNKTFIDFGKDAGSKKCGDANSYSLILNLRSVYIIDCIKNNKKWSTKDLLSLIKGTTGSLEAYSGYLRVKNDEKTKKTLPIAEAEKLLTYISKKLKEHEKWLKAKKE
jgi:predicted nucleotidyltransferase